MKKVVCYLFVLIGLTACAASAPQPETLNLSEVTTPRAVQLKEPIVRKYSNGQEEVLLAGAYVPQKENGLGTYFWGAGFAFVQKIHSGAKYSMHEGGFWMSKSEPTQFRFFTVVNSQFGIAETVDAAQEKQNKVMSSAVVVVSDPTRPGLPTASQAVGAGVSTLVVNSIIDSAKGQIILPPSITDSAVVGRLQEAVRAAGYATK